MYFNPYGFNLVYFIDHFIQFKKSMHSSDKQLSVQGKQQPETPKLQSKDLQADEHRIMWYSDKVFCTK